MIERKSRASAARSGFFAFCIWGAAALGSGCLERPIQPVTPNTSNVFVSTVTAASIDKIDLVFMIDNSVSMGDKQKLLKQAVPNLLRRLIQPDCLDENREKVAANSDGTCPSGSRAAFRPIKDIHVAAITSALGSHGGVICAEPTKLNPYNNDYARLLPSVRPPNTVPDPQGTGFLAWTGGGDVERKALLDDFEEHVVAAGETGCGFEASLESWYRFLVDPNPPKDSKINRVGDVSQRVVERDEVLLEQRRAFLRSDSLVAIIMLSDENDCSIIDQGLGWTVTSPDDVPYLVTSEACDADPNDVCCHSCFFGPPEGCQESPRCQAENTNLPAELDRRNVRCAAQKARFGMDLLWPVERYIDGLTKAQIVDEWDPARPLVQNELLMARGEAGPRNPALVVLAGIVGVPWQDIATEESKSGAGLEYLTSKQIDWGLVLGDRKTNTPPTDPLMIESIAPRPGLAAPGSWDNPINGNEVDMAVIDKTDDKPASDDLQYACVFPLVEPLDCALAENEQRCDCESDLDIAKNKPLCQDGKGAPQVKRQYFAKAYPGTRFLEVLKGVGESGIVASICPKNPVDEADPSNPDRGYNPAVDAIIERLSVLLGGQCLPNELEITAGEVDCLVIEAKKGLSDPGCGRPGRKTVSEEVERAVLAELVRSEICGGKTGKDCAEFDMCNIVQLTAGAERESCFHDEIPLSPGFCYIDPAKGAEAGGTCVDGICENPFVQGCGLEERRMLRFVGTEEDPVPERNSTVLTACVDS